ncbi:MvdC/MvdD family ATP grasp protein [Engelhardtia mirabilis]|uniref:RimK-like ATP-grasp domain protein n=1 Tax=Engelhardtia mirabilis TaxID=2528011 RepID=A0A518BHN7_9BACT|nr:RimK-like ATP-grasp domain protein [Planctomycetes bacterium Pla133]QDV00801.1 RimK-like ATP-grasp domain protein [Planctomycetes bacterium Pla86]
MKVLILTKSDDNQSIADVTRALNERGAEVLRLDTDHFPGEVRMSERAGAEGVELELTTPAGSARLSEVDALWHRRLAFGARLPEGIDHQQRVAAIEESKRSLMGALGAAPCFKVDPMWRIRHAGQKSLQLAVAREVGLDLPRTLVSNDADALREFWDACDGKVVAKMQSSFAIYDDDGNENVVFTNTLSQADIDDPQGLELCPMTFQEKLEKRLELRVTVVGDRVFSAAVDSARMEGAEVDWRRKGAQLIGAWKEHQLPADVERGCLDLMDRLQLNYGAIDIVATPQGRHVFLEVNPSGEFFWLEREPGLPIAAALADVLTGRAPRREELHETMSGAGIAAVMPQRA